MVGRGPILSLVSLVIAACFLEPADHVTGQWGGNGITLDAGNAKVQVEFACSKAVSPGLRLDAGGHFETIATITSGSGTFLRLSGDVDGADMTLVVNNGFLNYADRYTLRRSAPPDFSNWGCFK